MLNEMYITVCNMSITTIFVIMLVFTLRIFLKKSSRFAVYYLWGIVGFRLACPITVSSAFSFFNLPILKSISVTGNELSWEQTANLSAHNVWNIHAPSIQPIVETIIVDGIKEELIFEPEPLLSIGITDVKAILWLLVCILILASQVYCYMKLKRNLQMAVKIEDNIYECDKIRSPFVLGFFRPRIYIPLHLQEKERCFVLEHEKYHIKRHDHQAKIVSIILLAIHWFNPFVWLAYFLFCKDMEISCDEHVIETIGVEKKQDYSNTLLDFATGHKQWALGTLAFGETSVFERVQGILKFKKPGKFTLIIAIGFSVIVAIIGVTNGKRDNAIRNVSKELDAFQKYEYQLSDESKSFLIYKEYYRYGILEEYEIIMYADFEESGFKKKDCIVIQQGNKKNEKDEWGTTLEIKTNAVEIANYTETDKYGYKAVAPTFYLEDSSKWQNIKLEQDIVIAAFNLDDGMGVAGYSCESYQDMDNKYNLVASNPGVILYHLVVSEEEVDKLLKQFEKPFYAKDLYNAKNPYIGNHIADGTLLKVLGIPSLGNYTMELQTSEEPYGITLHFKEYPINEVEFHEKMLKRAAKFLALTDNAGYFEWTYPNISGTGTEEKHYYVKDMEQMLGISNLKAYAQSEETLQELYEGIENSDWAKVEAGYACQDVMSGWRPFTRKRVITGRHPNAESDSTYLVYSYEKVTFKDITTYLFGSQYPKEKEMYVVIQP